MSSTPAERLRMALEMYEFGEGMRRARIRREDPSLTDEQVDEQVMRWRMDRPGAPHGDAAGRPSRRLG